MTLRFHPAALLSLPLALALAASACSDDAPSATSDGSESGSESGDTTGDEDSTTTTTTTTGDGDGDPATGDGDGDACPVGSEGCPCTDGGSCDTGLMCDGGICVPAQGGDGDGDPTGDGDGDPTTTGDGDGDGTGDGDGDPTTTGGDQCEGEEFIEILAVDAADSAGWDEIMSGLGEGQILAWDGVTIDAFVSWDLDIPCDDTWHVWVRGVDNQTDDSFFVLVDGEPNPVPIFELDCTGEPGGQMGLYRWTELNWRDQDSPGCDYVEDPWVQDWAAGAHNVTLGYRESIAVSRIWITNTDQMPPMP